MKKRLLFILLSVFYACQREWKNPYDPDNMVLTDEWTPRNLCIEQLSFNMIKLTWEQSEVQIDGFKINKKVGNNPWQVDHAVLDKNSRDWMDTSVVINSSHSYRLYAYNKYFNTESIEISIIPTIPAPSQIRIQQLSCFHVQLQWQDNSNGEDGFKIDRKIGELDWDIEYAKVDSNCTVWNDTAAVTGQLNHYRIYAYYGNESSLVIQGSVNPSFPAPMNLSINILSDAEIQLTWAVHSCDKVSGYNIFRKRNDEDYEIIRQTKGTFYNDTDILNENTYSYKVQAYWGSITSGISLPLTIESVKICFLKWSKSHHDPVEFVEFSPDNHWVASCGGSTLQVWDAETGMLRWAGNHGVWSDIKSIDFSADNSMVVSGGNDQIKVWDAANGSLRWTGEQYGGVCVEFNSDFSKVVSGGVHDIRLWDAASGTLLWSEEIDNWMYVRSIHFSPDDSKLVIGGSKYDAKMNELGAMMVLNSASGKLLWKQEYDQSIFCTDFNRDNSQVISGSGYWSPTYKGHIKIWNASTGKLQWTGDHDSGVLSTGFSPDNSRVVSCGDYKIKVWDSVTGLSLWTREHGDEVNSVCFSPDNSMVISGGCAFFENDPVRIWDNETGDLLWRLNSEYDVSHVSFSSDNNRVVLGSSKKTVPEDGKVQVWEFQNEWQVK